MFSSPRPGVAVVIAKIFIFASRMLEGRYTYLYTCGDYHPKWLSALCFAHVLSQDQSMMRISDESKTRKNSRILLLFAKVLFNSAIKLSSVSVESSSLLLKQSRLRYFADAKSFHLPHYYTPIVCIFFFSAA